MAETDRILRSRRQGGSRFISEEEEERLRRNVEERRKVGGRTRGHQGYARKDRLEEEVNVNTRKESLHEGQGSTGEEEGSMRKRDRERTERHERNEGHGCGYGWRKNGKDREIRTVDDRMGGKQGAGGKDRGREEGSRGGENEVEGRRRCRWAQRILWWQEEEGMRKEMSG